MVSNIEVTPLLARAFHFTPGERINFNHAGDAEKKRISWEVKVNPYNETFLECSNSGAIAYFEEDENQFHFTYYEGTRDCLLYYFFLGCYKIQSGYYQDLELHDSYPLSLVYPKPIRWIYDFISPFSQVAKARYKIHYSEIDDYISPGKIVLHSSLQNTLGRRNLNSMKFRIEISEEGIDTFSIQIKDNITELERCTD